MSSTITQIQLGDFVLDKRYQHLRLGDDVILLEPKVYDVLLYLIQHQDRLIPLSELHEQVWAGRVVSDTAVRRTISKLRLALVDTDTQEPRYIKSVMKRGYQLICPINALSTEPELHDQVSSVSSQDAIVDTLLQETTDHSPSSSISRQWQKLLLLLLLLSITALLYFLWPTLEKTPAQPVSLSKENAERVTFSPGKKLDLAISTDGQLLVFSGTDGAHDAWRLYLYNRQSSQITLLSNARGTSISAVSFIEEDQRIAFVDSQFGNSTIHAVDLTGHSNEPAELLLDDFFAIGNLLYHSPSNSLIFGGTKRQGDNGHYYRLDLTHGGYEQLTYSSAAHVTDFAASLSPDQQHLLLIRYQLGNYQPKLQVYRLADRELLMEHELNMMVRQSHWLDEHHVLLLTNAGSLERFRLSDGEIKPRLQDIEQPLHRFVVRQQFIYGISRRPTERHFVEADWPDRRNMKLFPLGQALSAHYRKDSSDVWLVQSDQHGFSLISYDPVRFSEQTIFTQQASFQLIDQHADGNLLLLKSDNRLWLHDATTNSRLAISMHGQLVERGYFSKGGKEVLFTVSKGGSWMSYRYLLDSGMLIQFNRGYRVMYPWGDNFLAITAAGEVTLLNSGLQPITELPMLLVFDVPYQIQTFQHGLLISNMQMQQTKLWLLSNQLEVEDFNFPRNQLHPNTSMKADGSQLIYFGTSAGHDQIFRINLN